MNEQASGFGEIAPYLQHPLVLIGFALLLVFGLLRGFLGSDKLPIVGRQDAGRLLSAVLRYGFVLALMIIVLGFGLVFYREYRAEEARIEREQAVIAALAEERRKWEQTLAEQRLQRDLDQQTIRSLNAAYSTVEAQAKQPDAPPGVSDALVRLAKGATEEAEAILKTTAERQAAAGQQANAEAAEAYRQLGVLASLRDTEKALGAYRQAVELKPDDTWAWIFIARLEQLTGRLKAAEVAARRAKYSASITENERDKAVVEHEIGDILRGGGRLREAKLAYQSFHDSIQNLS